MYGKNFDLKKGIIENISYDRRAYEPVVDRSHSKVIYQKIDGKQNSGTDGLKISPLKMYQSLMTCRKTVI